MAALRRSCNADWHLFIVDNASTDDSVERLTGLGDDVSLIRSPTNGGWTGGNNLGIEAALSARYDWLFILNNDAFVEPDTLELLPAEATAQAAREGWPVLGPIHRGSHASDYDFIGSATDPRTGIPA